MGSSYVEIFKKLKIVIQPDTLGVKIKGVRQTRNGDSMLELVPRTEIVVLNFNITSGEEEVKNAVRRHFAEAATVALRRTSWLGLRGENGQVGTDRQTPKHGVEAQNS